MSAGRDPSWADVVRRASAGAATEAPGEEWVHAQRYLVFRVEGSRYALPVERAREIVRLRPITAVPRLPEAVIGVISLRGQVIQVVDLRRRLRLPAAEPSRRTRIVVAHDGDGRIAGLLVDAVEEVVAIPEEPVREVAVVGEGVVEGLFRRAGGLVSVLDLDRVMDVDAAG